MVKVFGSLTWYMHDLADDPSVEVIVEDIEKMCKGRSVWHVRNCIEDQKRSLGS